MYMCVCVRVCVNVCMCMCVGNMLSFIYVYVNYIS